MDPVVRIFERDVLDPRVVVDLWSLEKTEDGPDGARIDGHGPWETATLRDHLKVPGDVMLVGDDDLHHAPSRSSC